MNKPDRKESAVDLDAFDREIRANQLQPADANGGNVAAAMLENLDKALLPRSITGVCDGIANQFGATANMMRNNAQRLRLRADQLDQGADRLRDIAQTITSDLKSAVHYERRAYQLNQAAVLASDEVPAEQ